MSIDMNIQLGKPVMGSDGEKIGEVDRLIIDKESYQVREFLIQEGTLLQTDRIVDVDQVTRIDEDGTVHLSIPSSEAESLQPFVETRYLAPGDRDLEVMPQAWAAGGAGGGPLLWAPAGPGHDHPAGRSLFEPASPPTADVEPDRPVDQMSVVVDTGTNVIGKNGEELGSVDEVFYDDDGQISRFRVKSGMIFSKDVDVPMNWVETIRPDGVQLSVTAEEAESAGEVT